MSNWLRFNVTAKNTVDRVYNLSTDTFKVSLTNTSPTFANSVKADITELGGTGGYAAQTTTLTVTNNNGTAVVTGTNVSFTASGGNIGPFRYAVLWDDTPTVPLDPLQSWYDFKAAVTINSGSTLVIPMASCYTLP